MSTNSFTSPSPAKAASLLPPVAPSAWRRPKDEEEERGLSQTLALSIARTVLDISRNNSGLPPPPSSVFHCFTKAPLTLEEFALRLADFLYADPSSFVVARALLERTYRVNPSLFTESCLHKLLGTTFVVALKSNQDKFFGNTYYSECLGVSLKSMNAMEVELLNILSFQAFVSPEEFSLHYNSIVHETHNNARRLTNSFPTPSHSSAHSTAHAHIPA